MSPITAKLRRPTAPTLPTTAVPVLTPARKIGQPGWVAAIDRPAATIARAVRAARSAWSGCSVAVLKVAMIPSPANCSITPPWVSMTGTTTAQYVFSISITTVGARVSLNVVKLARSAKRTLTRRSTPPSRALPGSSTRRSATCDGRYGRKSAVEAADLAGRLLDEGDLVAARAVAAEVVEDGRRRLAALLGRRHRGDRPGVPLVEPGERRVQVQPAERRRQRSAPAVLAPRPGGDREEREEHQDVPLPPAQPPVPAEDDGDHRLAEEHERDADREDHDAAAAPVELQRPDRGEGVEGHADRGKDRQRPDRLAGRQGAVERRQPGDGQDGPDDHRDREDREQERPVAEHDHRPRPAEGGHRAGGEDRGDEQPDRRRDDEPLVRAGEEHAGGRERVQAEEPRGREERQRDQDEAGVPLAAGDDARDVGEGDADDRGREDEPEVARVVLPLEVEAGLAEQQGQPDDGQDEEDQPAARDRLGRTGVGGHAHGSSLAISRLPRGTRPATTRRVARPSSPGSRRAGPAAGPRCSRATRRCRGPGAASPSRTGPDPRRRPRSGSAAPRGRR